VRMGLTSSSCSSSMWLSSSVSEMLPGVRSSPSLQQPLSILMLGQSSSSSEQPPKGVKIVLLLPQGVHGFEMDSLWACSQLTVFLSTLNFAPTEPVRITRLPACIGIATQVSVCPAVFRFRKQRV
jgi:hypothetical protein